METPRRTAPPGGSPPPAEAGLAGASVALRPLAEAVADRYFVVHPEDLDRYGPDVARAWEIHDTTYLLSWAIGAAEGRVDLERQIAWLAGVLEARDFPLEHLAANLDICADIVAERVAGGDPVAAGLRDAAALIRGTPTFL